MSVKEQIPKQSSTVAQWPLWLHRSLCGLGTWAIPCMSDSASLGVWCFLFASSLQWSGFYLIKIKNEMKDTDYEN